MVVPFHHHRWLHEDGVVSWVAWGRTNQEASYPTLCYLSLFTAGLTTITMCSWIFIAPWTLGPLLCVHLAMKASFWTRSECDGHSSCQHIGIAVCMGWSFQRCPLFLWVPHRPLMVTCGSSWSILLTEHSWVGYFVFIINNEHRFLFSTKEETPSLAKYKTTI